MCQICESDKRNACKVNDISFCHECLRFFQHLAKLNNRSQLEEIQHQTLYFKTAKINFG